MSKAIAPEFDRVLEALRVAHAAVEPLTPEDRAFVIRTLVDRLGIGSGGGAFAQRADLSPQQFLAERQPTSAVQRVACLAYYLTRFRNQARFKVFDIEALNTEAGEKAFNTKDALDNAANVSGYLERAGGGEKAISTLGTRIVEALPDQVAVRKILGDVQRERKSIR